ncbi:MAG: imidazole glycerol phosphate synthase subunit HisH [Pseudomonadales bacterium]|nr:imidazole glycerol phosphate synthase subunit HisH [Pseudomonadales bacterium]
MKTVAVIDYGMGNLHSASKALAFVADNIKVMVTAKPEEILAADHVVFPGVGAIRDCVGEIRRSGLAEVVLEAAKTKPFLAICVGMQCLMTHSEENNGVDCLNIYPGEVKYFGDKLEDAQGNKLKVPHMGWNQVSQTIPHPLWKDIEEGERFYFVHSYFVEPKQSSLIAGESDYPNPFVVALAKDNQFAVQFHPEKSQKSGLTLLKNFVNWDGQS